MTGLPPPAPSPTPPPRVALPSHEQELLLPVEGTAGELIGARDDTPRRQRVNVGVALLPAALIVFLIAAFVAIVWTVVAAAGATG
ncbi:MAG: hypothetical protein M3295_08985 [Chloroflexota bacterium]|nr:hypothetical protein [Chloroflexota bacterium]